MKLPKVSYFLLFFLLLIPGIVLPAFADTTYFNSTLAELKPFQTSQKSVSVFYPIFFLIAVFFFTSYGLKNRNDQLGMIFTIASAVMCILLSFIFISPYDFTFTTNLRQVTVEQNHLINTIVNSTSVIDNSNEAVIIPHDKTFSLILSSIFTVFALLNGLLSILILTKWSK